MEFQIEGKPTGRLSRLAQVAFFVVMALAIPIWLFVLFVNGGDEALFGVLGSTLGCLFASRLLIHYHGQERIFVTSKYLILLSTFWCFKYRNKIRLEKIKSVNFVDLDSYPYSFAAPQSFSNYRIGLEMVNGRNILIGKFLEKDQGEEVAKELSALMIGYREK